MERNRWWLVTAVGLVVYMAQLDASIIAVALPAIESDLGIRTSLSEWTVLGYLLPVIALVLPCGRWLDQVGRRAAFVFATAGFAATSVLAGIAPGIGWLVAARITQGVFGAVLLASTPTLSVIAVRPEARGRAMGVVTTLGPLGAVSGPAVGGVLVELFGWPSIFYVNVPISVVVIGLALHEMRPDGGLRLPDRAWATEAALLGAATALLFLGLSLVASHGVGWSALVLLAVPPVLVWRRTATSRSVRELMRIPGVAAPHVALLGMFAATGFVQFLVPFYLHQVVGASVAVTGLAILVSPLAMATFGAVSGVLADRVGSRGTAILGTVVTTVGLVLLTPLGPSWTVSDTVWRLGVIGVGVGLFNASNMTMVMSTVPHDRLGTTAGSTSLARQLGLALGPAIATAIWALSGYTTGGMRAAFACGAAFGAASALALAGTQRAVVGVPEAGLPGVAVPASGAAGPQVETLGTSSTG